MTDNELVEQNLRTLFTEVDKLKGLTPRRTMLPPKGKDGKDGVDGKDGKDGRDGTDGVSGDHGADGADGADGSDGDVGPKGDTGLAGKVGEKGEKGDRGQTGAKGVEGDRGEAGAEGKIGPTGKDGRDGKDGKIGKTGPAGKDGRDGKDGKTGVKGAIGKDGKDGKIGKTGPAGKDGRDGKDGKSPDIKPYLDKANENFSKWQQNVNKSLASLGGGGSYRILDNADVERVKHSDAFEDGILIFNQAKNKFVLTDFTEILMRLQTESEMQYTKLIDDAGSTLYIGEAVPGTAQSASTWRIKKVYTDPSTEDIDIEWADGTAAFEKIWDDRLTYTYS